MHFRFNALGREVRRRTTATPRRRGARRGSRGRGRRRAPIVLEGGSIPVDGAGTLLDDRAVPAAPQPQPRAVARARSRRRCASRSASRRSSGSAIGLVEDRDTDGHVDLIAAFTRPGAGAAPDASRRTTPTTSTARRTARPRWRRPGIDVIELSRSCPYVEVGGETVAVGYLNLYVCNGGVIVPVCGDDQRRRGAAIDRAPPTRAARSSAVPGARAGVRRRRAALHHPAGAGRAVDDMSERPSPDGRAAAPVARARPVRRRAAAARWVLVQQRWHPDPDEHQAALARGDPRRGRGGRAARVPAGAHAVALLRDHARRAGGGRRAQPEDLQDGPTFAFAARARRRETGAYVHASLYERADGPRRPGLQHRDRASRPTARWSSRTRKLHIPVTAGYYEDHYFRPGPADGDPFPRRASELGERARLGFPTCWDQWFPELARAYSLAGAEVLVYPTAIGSEPDHPEFDTAAAVAAGDRRQRHRQRHVHGGGQPDRRRAAADVLRLVASSPTPTAGSSSRRRATSPPCSSPTSTSISASDWLELFPFLTTRRPDAYGSLTG